MVNKAPSWDARGTDFGKVLAPGKRYPASLSMGQATGVAANVLDLV